MQTTSTIYLIKNISNLYVNATEFKNNKCLCIENLSNLEYRKYMRHIHQVCSWRNLQDIKYRNLSSIEMDNKYELLRKYNLKNNYIS